MDRGNVNPTQHLLDDWGKSRKQPQSVWSAQGVWTQNSSNTSPVWWNSLSAMLCAFKKIFARPHFTVCWSWNKSLHLQSLQRSCCENSGSPASSYVMRRHHSTTYMQSLHTINGLLAVGLVGNLLCGRPSYIMVSPRKRNGDEVNFGGP